MVPYPTAKSNLAARAAACYTGSTIGRGDFVMTKQELLQKADSLPLSPGVYIMMDKTGLVIYVGKAKKLKNRVSQYFQSGSGHNEKTRMMVSQVDHLDRKSVV